MKLKSSLVGFWKEEEGQDLIEYTLLLAFIAFAAAGLMSGARTNATGIWSAMNVAMSSAVTSGS